MIYLAGEPDDMWWNGEVQEVYLGADLIWKSGPTIEVHEVSRSGGVGSTSSLTLISLSPPPGETWHVEIEGTLTFDYLFNSERPRLLIGNHETDRLPPGWVSESGEITSTSSQIVLRNPTALSATGVTFSGTITVTHPD